MKPDLSYRSTQGNYGTLPHAATGKPLLSDIKRIYDEESLTDEQAVALEAMHQATAKNPIPRGKRIPRR